MAGYSQYGAAPVVAHEPKASRTPLLLLAGCGAVLVLGLLVAGGLLWLGANARSKVAAATAPANATGPALEPAEDSDEPSLGAFGQGSLDFDRKRFDVAGFLPKAERLAQQHLADAKLIRIDAMGINRAGIVDLTARSQNMVMYRFRSPAASKPPPDFPENAKYEANCVVYVMAMQAGLQTHVNKWTCDDPIVPMPRCTPARVWQEAEQRGAPKGNLIGMLGYWADDSNPKPRWYVNIEPSFSTFLPDGC
jgi:hypothetical protein